MRIIDPHVHVWARDPRFPWAPETTHPPEADATPEVLMALMRQNGVERTVLVQVIHYRWDNRYTIDAVRRYPKTFVGVCRVNPEDPAAPDQLSEVVATQTIQGVRLSPSASSSDDWFTGPLMDPIFGRAAELHVPMLILTGPSRLGDLARLIERHPDLDVVIDHMADCHPDDDAGAAALLSLARYPRVYVKISHTWSISREEYPWRDTHGLVERVYQAFGPRRIMWATDWPVCLAKTTYARTLSVVRDEMPFIAKDDREWVLGKTALRLWPFD